MTFGTKDLISKLDVSVLKTFININTLNGN